MNQLFRIVGFGYQESQQPKVIGKRNASKKPLLSIAVLVVIFLACILAGVLSNADPNYMNLDHLREPPNQQFWFGTDSLGRNLFVMIWHGGRVSLFIGILATIISTTIGVIYGSISGIAPAWVDDLFMRIVEILLSVPSILLIIFLQALFGQSNAFSIAIVIGVSSWMPIAKIVRTEIKQIWQLDYVAAGKVLGGSFSHLLRRHLIPNYFPTILFMMINTVGSAIATESILSFFGIGLPLNVISWGSILSLSERAILSNAWWIILVPAFFLITTVICMTNIAEYIRQKNTSIQHYLS